MTTKFCACQSPSHRRKIADDTFSFDEDKDAEELQPLPNGFSHEHENENENDSVPCLSSNEAETTPQGDRRRRIKHVWDYYLLHNTLHGLHYVFDTKSIWRKVIWIAILLSAGGAFINEVKTSITQYFEYPFSTLATVDYPNKIVLPAISICDLRDIRKTILTSAKFRRGRSAQGNSTEHNPERVLGDVLEEAFSILDDILISCVLKRGVNESREVPCDREDFTLFLSSDGHTCYTLNYGGENRTLLETDNVGLKYGLHLVLNTKPLEEGKTYGGSGVKVILHQQGELPLKRVGFHVPPGYVTFVDMKKEKLTNLRDPFSTNCGGKTLDYFPAYSRNKCFLEGLTKHVSHKCDCRGWFMPETKDNFTLCSLNKTINCMWPAWEEFESRMNSPVDCPVDCEKVSYKAQLSQTLYLPQKLVPVKQKYEKLTRGRNLPNDTDEVIKFMLDYYVVLKFFFSELRIDVFEQTPSYGFFKLVGDAGGQLGLVLGASFITLLEVIDLFVMVVVSWLKSKYGGKSTDV